MCNKIQSLQLNAFVRLIPGGFILMSHTNRSIEMKSSLIVVIEVRTVLGMYQLLSPLLVHVVTVADCYQAKVRHLTLA